jgi:beta-galactosidase/beta-glucuronidase
MKLKRRFFTFEEMMRQSTILLQLLLPLLLTSCQFNNQSPLEAISPRKTVVLSGDWQFQIDISGIGEREKWYDNNFNRNDWGKVTVPMAWDCYETALWGFEGIGWYSTLIKPEDFQAGRRTEIIFNRVMFYSKVWLNGEFIGENIGGYLPFSFDITKYLKPGKDNYLVMRVDNKPRIEWLPAGKQIEWIQYGGILQPVKLVNTPHTYIEDFTIKTEPLNGGAKINCIVSIPNETGNDSEMEVNIEIALGKNAVSKSVKFLSKSMDTAKVSVDITLGHAELWSPDTPVLYNATASLKLNKQTIDALTERIGIRKVGIEGTSITLNGKPIIIKGVNRYDEYGRMGPVVPIDTLRKELALMKSAGINTIRVHYPQSPDLLSLYDEYGFMMMEEVPLNWWGRTVWGEVKMSLDILNFAKPALRSMVKRDKNHPCVIIWSMGNENETDKEPGITVMRELIRLAKKLDSTRLITYTVSYDPRKHLAFDETDIVCFNKYNGLDKARHISQIDSLGYQRTAKELAELRSFYSTKPLLFTEFGCQAVKGLHGDVYFSEEFQAAYITKIWKAIVENRGIAGGILWSWADYFHRKDFVLRSHYGSYGVVTVDRRPKKGLEALSRMYKWSQQ